MKTEQQIEAIMDKVVERYHVASKVPGMTYEQGVRAALDWVMDEVDEDPLED